MADTESDIEPVAPTIVGRTEDQERVADDITMTYGGAWVLVSVADDDDESLNVNLAWGQGLDVETTRLLLRRLLEAL